MRTAIAILLGLGCAACAGDDGPEPPNLQQARNASAPFSPTEIASFDEPWAMTFLPAADGRLLVTEKSGALYLVSRDGAKTAVSGVPKVAYGGQGGLGDVVLHPNFTDNRVVYVSYAEAGGGKRGAAVARAVLDLNGEPALRDLNVIWRQQPKVDGGGHYGHRIAFDNDGYLLLMPANGSGSTRRRTWDPTWEKSFGSAMTVAYPATTPSPLTVA